MKFYFTVRLTIYSTHIVQSFDGLYGYEEDDVLFLIISKRKAKSVSGRNTSRIMLRQVDSVAYKI